MTPMEMVRTYYPERWSRERVEALVRAGRLGEDWERVVEAEGESSTLDDGDSSSPRSSE